ncbi:hypothetical protein IJX73_00600 [bacterium]|nr:hypothetical protein [bacterium]MBQ9149409.1 hypothetical protein [bacterium]
MKKALIISMLLIFAFGTYAEARTKYDSTGRNVIYDGTLRGRKRAAEQQKMYEKKMQAAAAARLDYEQALKSMQPQKPKSNFYQDRIKEQDYYFNY